MNSQDSKDTQGAGEMNGPHGAKRAHGADSAHSTRREQDAHPRTALSKFGRAFLSVALVLAAMTVFWWGGVPVRLVAAFTGREFSPHSSFDESDVCYSHTDGHARLITTMVVRYNQFVPNGASAIVLVDGAIYTPNDLAPLVTAGYCAPTDLANQLGGNWKWNGATRMFDPAPQ